jgi:hypothetical protein
VRPSVGLPQVLFDGLVEMLDNMPHVFAVHGMQSIERVLRGRQQAKPGEPSALGHHFNESGVARDGKRLNAVSYDTGGNLNSVMSAGIDYFFQVRTHFNILLEKVENVMYNLTKSS